jgi:hypothetical protein
MPRLATFDQIAGYLGPADRGQRRPAVVLNIVIPLTLRLLAATAACALSLACSGGDAARPVPTTIDAAPTVEPTSVAGLNLAATAIVATLAPAPAATASPAPSVPPRPEATASPASPPTAAANAPTAAPAVTPATRPAPVTVRVDVNTGDRSFEPHQVHGNFDDTIVVTLHGSDERHSFTVPALGTDLLVDKGASVSATLVPPLSLAPPAANGSIEGIFAFYCRFHGSPTSGMHGFLILH